MTLHYHGPEHGYVDPNDREELAAIARGNAERSRERRVEYHLMRELTGEERARLRAVRSGLDRLAHRAFVLGHRGARLTRRHNGVRAFLVATV